MKSTILGNRSIAVSNSKFYLMCVLLAVAGCAHNPDIRVGHDSVEGVTSISDKAYVDCVKGDASNYTTTFIREDNGKTDLFLGSNDPTKADGLVVLSSANGHSTYSAYQRDAWYDKGRLLDAAQACSKG